MTDEHTDPFQALRDELTAAPSPAFRHGVVRRIGMRAQRRPSWRSAWVAAAGAAAVVAVAVWMGQRSRFPIEGRTAAVAMSAVDRPVRTETRAVTGERRPGPGRAASRRPDARAAAGARSQAFSLGTGAAAFETIVPDDQRRAVERVLEGYRRRRTIAPAEAVLSRVDDDGRVTLIPLAIPPLAAIEPLATAPAADIRGGRK